MQGDLPAGHGEKGGGVTTPRNEPLGNPGTPLGPAPPGYKRLLTDYAGARVTERCSPAQLDDFECRPDSGPCARHPAWRTTPDTCACSGRSSEPSTLISGRFLT